MTVTIKEFFNNFGNAKERILNTLYCLFFTHDSTHLILTDNIGGNTGKTALIFIIEELTIFLDENPFLNFNRHNSVEQNVESWMRGNPSKPSCYKTYVDPKILNMKKWVIECTNEEMKNIDHRKMGISVIELTKQQKSNPSVYNFFSDGETARRNCYTIIAMILDN